MTKDEEPRSVFDESKRTEGETLYFGMIDRAMDAQEYRVISNGKPAHAVYLIYKLFKAARREVKVLTGRLARTLDGVLAWGDPEVCVVAVDFLRRGGRLSILIDEELDCSDGPHPLLVAVVDAGLEDRLTLAQPQEDFRESSWSHHFLLMDGTALRIETDAEKAEAVVNFNDPELVGKISDVFDDWLSNAERMCVEDASPAPAL